MRIVSISDECLSRYAANDGEFLLKHGRPCVLVLKLQFRGKKRDFAVPFRSNIAPNVPKWQYFALPPRPTTKPRYRHGIHYIKMFPIEKQFQQRFRIEGNAYYENIQRILNENDAEIVRSCQEYLKRYELEGKPHYAVDIDKLIELIESE